MCDLHLEKYSFSPFCIAFFFISTICWGLYQANSCGLLLPATQVLIARGQIPEFAALEAVTLCICFKSHCSFFHDKALETHPIL